MRALVALMAINALGCSLQTTTGWATRNPDFAPRLLQVEGQLEDMRRHGPVLGVRGVAVVEGAERPIALRNAQLFAGYQLRPRFRKPGFEAGLDLGLGEPTFVDFDGIGGYVGARASLLYRLYGDADTDPTAYYTATFLLDVVAGSYLGVWTAPAETGARPVVADSGGFVGFRFGIGTDVARAPLEGQAK